MHLRHGQRRGGLPDESLRGVAVVLEPVVLFGGEVSREARVLESRGEAEEVVPVEKDEGSGGGCACRELGDELAGRFFFEEPVVQRQPTLVRQVVFLTLRL